VDIDVDASAELVDLGRVFTRWLFNWEKIWVGFLNINKTLCYFRDIVKS
jgi:hypothetical membrane protein